jgi:AbrB family looped-hinge helix DNA binding protein
MAGPPRLDKDTVLARVRTMARVTSKLQVTVPKSIAQRFSIKPGDEIDWIPAGDGVRVVKRGRRATRAKTDERALRLRLFDLASERQRKRDVGKSVPAGADRGWTREDLYRRGRSG